MHSHLQNMAVRRRVNPSRASRAFTLTELLVTVALIGLLLALVIPSFQHVRRSAQVTGCQSNLRSLAQATLTYATEHNGALVDAGLAHGGSTATPEIAWVYQLRPYLDAPELASSTPDLETDSEDGAMYGILRSPLDDSPHWPKSLGGDGEPVPGAGGTPRQTSYALNDFISRTHSPYLSIDPFAIPDRLDRIPAPGATVSFVTLAFRGEFASTDHVHAAGWFESFPPPPALAASQIEMNSVSGPDASWDARSNYAFLDGHVATRTFAEVFAPPFDADGDGSITVPDDFITAFDPQRAGRLAAVTSARGD